MLSTRDMDRIKFRQLRADEIEVRVGDKKNGKMSLLLFQDARCGMRILDETVGEYGWVCNYRREGESLFCGIAIKAPDGTWLWKWNAGAPSNFEATKGEASDAFKRSCVLWGIGRSLYSAPKIRIPESNATHRVSKIEYDENGNICDLQIVDWNGNVVYNLEDGKETKVSEISREDVLKAVCSELKETVEDTQKLKKFFYYYQERCENFESWNANLVRKLFDKWMSK